MKGRWHAVVLTYLRPEQLKLSLGRLAEQDEIPVSVIVVDNAPLSQNEQSVQELRERGIQATYLPSSENEGPAGGRSRGMREALLRARDSEWIAFLDDDDPLPSADFMRGLLDEAERLKHADSSLAAIGLRGARFDWRRARTRRVEIQHDGNLVKVDHLHGGFFPTYAVSVLTRMGGFREDFFYGFEELELGLRLTTAGFSLYMDVGRYARYRELLGHHEPLARPRPTIQPATWQRYYGLRNLIFILLLHKKKGTALRVSVVRAVLKPLINLPVRPRASILTLQLNSRAILDAWTGRLGRTVDPGHSGTGPSPGQPDTVKAR